MNRKTKTRVGFLLFWPLMFCLIASSVSAAELRGRIWEAKTGKAPKGGSLKLSCGGNPNPHSLVGSGSFSIRNVPEGSCKITVSVSGGNRASRNISINKPVVQFSGEIRKAGNQVLLVPR